MSNFVHLHVHSEYSLLDGACRITDLPKVAKENGMTSVAITDHGVMYGVIDFYRACLSENIKPIIGCEVYVAPNSRFDKVSTLERTYFHLVLLCENNTGYKNLCTLVSKGFTEGFYGKPRIDFELLEQYHEGLIALSACVAGEIPQKILAGQYDEAIETAERYSRLFGPDHFYLEVQNHGLNEEGLVCDALYMISEKTGIPLVATNDVHYCRKQDAESQRILLDIQLNKTIKDGNPLGFSNDEFFLKNEIQMKAVFPSREDALTNTVLIAERCNVTFDFSSIHLPKFVPSDGSTPGDFLRKMTYEGFESKVNSGLILFDKHSKEEYIERIENELTIIEKMGYSQYYLIVQDFVSYSRKRGIPVGPGRGSGAGSLVAFLIDITQIDSIKYQLLFERFLNPERVSMPDFDVDFSDVRREEAIQYVQSRYGEDHTAQIVTFGTLSAKAVIRDVGRVLEIPYRTVDDIAKLIPQDINITLDSALSESQELREIFASDDTLGHLLSVAKKLEGMPRHASVHAAGVVITDKPVSDYVPVTFNDKMQITQYTMNTIADLGLLKFDFLGLRYLTIIDEAEKMVKDKNPEFSLQSIPFDDKKVFEAISNGQTDGVFQLESVGIRRMLSKLKPESFEDIIAAISLYRPGPMDSIPMFIEHRHGIKKPSYVSELLVPILAPTYGCIIYQEQVMQIFVKLADYTMGHADTIRKAISKKKMDVLASERPLFVENSAKHGLSSEDANKLFDDIVSFGRYAFNKCHATPYALLCYQTAFLKAHYPLEFYSALLTSVINNPEKIAGYISNFSENNIRVLPPDINHSTGRFQPENDAIRFSLLSLRNVGTTFVDSIVAERKENGVFKSFEDFMNRVNTKLLNKKEFESLIKAGVFDSFGIKRSQLLANYEKILTTASVSNRTEVEGQIDLFSSIQTEEPTLPSFRFEEMAELTVFEKMKFEREVSGLFLTGHLLDEYSEHISYLKPMNVLDVVGNENEETEENRVSNSVKDKQIVTLCGFVVNKTVKQTKTGESMAFITLEDKTSTVEIIVFPKTLASYGYLLHVDAVVCVKGTVSLRDEGKPKVLCQTVTSLFENGKIPSDELVKLRMNGEQKQTKQEVQSAENKKLRLYLKLSSANSPIYKKTVATLEVFSGDIPVFFYFSDTQKYLSTGLYADNSKFLLDSLKELLGEDAVVLKYSSR